MWESSSLEHWQIFLNSINGSLVPRQDASLNIILTGAFIASIPWAEFRTQLSANMAKSKKLFFILSPDCYLGNSELRVVTKWDCPP